MKQYLYRGPEGTMVDISDRCRKYRLRATEWAHEAQAGSWELVIDDPDSSIDIVGHRIIAVRETEVTGVDKFLAVGYTADQRVIRGPYRTGTGRQWVTGVVDINSVLSRRIVRNGKRPAESDEDRAAWLFGLAQAELIDDLRYLFTGDPVQMDKNDYSDQTMDAVMRDLREASGKNMWLSHFADDTEDFDEDLNPWGEFTLWYGHDEREDYSSTLRISNDLADIDFATTFPPDLEAEELEIRNDRIFSGILVPYDGGKAYGERTATATAYARRDGVMPSLNVKSAPKAKARVARYLAYHDGPDRVIIDTIRVPLAQANDVRPGMRLEVKYTHLGGDACGNLDEWTWVRVLDRTVSDEESEQHYALDLTMEVPSDVSVAACEVTPSGMFDPLGGSGSDANPSPGNVFYLRPGLFYPEVPTPGHQGTFHFPEWGSGVDYAGTCTQSSIRVVVGGEGTLTVHTAIYSGTPRNLVARLIHATGDGGYVYDETQTGVTGDDFTFDVSTHAGVNCYHWVDLTDAGPECGGKFGFAGAEWESA